MTRQIAGTLGIFNVALDHMRCDVGRGRRRGLAYLYRLLSGVWVVQVEAAGLVKRLAIGDPFGAICCWAEACEFGALPRVGDVGAVLLPRPPFLPPPRGVELRLPQSARDSKLTIRFWGKLGGFVRLCRVMLTQSAEWCGFVDMY